MNHISLFSGIGGFELASEWIGWDNIASCEINPFGNKVLEYYWPNALHHDDVKTFTKNLLDEKIKDWNTSDIILTGGFPCQPYSNAGKRKGKEDERHLWPEMLRVIQEIKPKWIVGENVRGLVNWSGGLVFEEVQSDLEDNGYEVQPFILPACSKNAPHRRDRIWFAAYSNGSGKGNNGGANKGEAKEIRRKDKSNVSAKLCSTWNATNSNSRRQSSKEYRQKESRRITKEGISENWENFPTQSPICRGDDGISSELDGITFPKWRNESIKAYGNAVVPQVVFEIFKAIEKYEQIKKDS